MKSPYANNGHAAYLPTATQAIARRAKEEPELRTFQAWSDDGYKIIKGSKHVGRNADGVCLFSADQVEKLPRSRRAYSHDPDAEADELVEAFGEDGLDGNPADYGDN